MIVPRYEAEFENCRDRNKQEGKQVEAAWFCGKSTACESEQVQVPLRQVAVGIPLPRPSLQCVLSLASETGKLNITFPCLWYRQDSGCQPGTASQGHFHDTQKQRPHLATALSPGRPRHGCAAFLSSVSRFFGVTLGVFLEALSPEAVSLGLPVNSLSHLLSLVNPFLLILASLQWTSG